MVALFHPPPRNATGLEQLVVQVRQRPALSFGGCCCVQRLNARATGARRRGHGGSGAAVLRRPSSEGACAPRPYRSPPSLLTPAAARGQRLREICKLLVQFHPMPRSLSLSFPLCLSSALFAWLLLRCALPSRAQCSGSAGAGCSVIIEPYEYERDSGGYAVLVTGGTAGNLRANITVSERRTRCPLSPVPVSFYLRVLQRWCWCPSLRTRL